MALSLQDGTFVWQKVKNALVGSNPASQQMFRDLRQYLATQGGNPQLQFIPIDGTYSSSDGGNNASQVLSDTACTVFAIYGLKVGTVETIFKGSANATTAGTDGTQKFALPATAAGDVFAVWPKGIAVASGLTVTLNTTRTGSTLTLLANDINGFVIIGA